MSEQFTAAPLKHVLHLHFLQWSEEVFQWVALLKVRSIYKYFQIMFIMTPDFFQIRA